MKPGTAARMAATSPGMGVARRHGLTQLARLGAIGASAVLAPAGSLVAALGHACAQAADLGEPALLRRLRFDIQCHNPTGNPLAAQPLWAYGPVSRTGHQALAEVSSSWPVTQQTDALGNTVLHWQTPPLPPHGLRTIRLDVAVHMARQPVPQPVEPGAWLQAERHTECDDPAIVALAAELRQGHPPAHPQGDARASVQAIYDWVRTHLNYAGYLPNDLGAAHALRERSGDCTEYAYLVVALCRAMGLPARALGGFVVEQDDAPASVAYHNWAEVHVDGAWRLVDAQKEALFDGGERYVALRLIRDQALSPMGLAHRFVTDGPAQIRWR